MRRDIDPGCASDAVPGVDLASEGAAYAAALLRRVAAGESCPGDFAQVVEFVSPGPMLQGFAAAMLDALTAASGVGHRGRK